MARSGTLAYPAGVPADDELTDDQLLRRYRRGDYPAFEQLYQRYRRPLYRYFVAATGDQCDADELYQELWLRVVKARDDIAAGTLRFWLYRTARNLCIDRLRRKRLSIVDTDPDSQASATAAPEQQVLIDDCAGQMREALARLPDEQRDAFLLKEESGLSLAQIAQLVDSGRETIKSRLRYAYKRLRDWLEDCL